MQNIPSLSIITNKVINGKINSLPSLMMNKTISFTSNYMFNNQKKKSNKMFILVKKIIFTSIKTEDFKKKAIR